MLIDRTTAATYARNVLATDSTIARILRDTLPFGDGDFQATNSFGVDAGGDLFDVSRDPGEAPAGAVLSRELLDGLTRDRAVVLASAYVESDVTERVPDGSPTRLIRRSVDGGFEVYYLVAGPQVEPYSLARIVHASQGMHRAVGALVEVREVELPDHGGTVSEEGLRKLLRSPLLVFMRMTSYDGYLLWRPRSGSQDMGE